MQETLIQDIMTTDLLTVNHDDIVTDVENLFNEHSIHHVLVLNDDGDLEGMISSTDLERTKTGLSFLRANSIILVSSNLEKKE